jgi:hypothetical protein
MRLGRLEMFAGRLTMFLGRVTVFVRTEAISKTEG